MSENNVLGEIRRRADQLGDLLRRCPTMDLLAHFSFHEEYADPSTYSEDTHVGQQVFVEYLTLLALKGECSIGIPPYPKLDLQDVHTLINEVFRLSLELPAPEPTGSDTGHERLRWLSRVLGLQSRSVRNPGFNVHRDLVFDQLLGAPEVDLWLADEFGFRYPEAQTLNRAAESLLNGRLARKKQEALSKVDAYRRAALEFKRGRSIPSELDAGIVRDLGRASTGKMKNKLRQLRHTWVFGKYGTLAQFTAAELAAEAGVPVETARAYLRARSSKFGSVEADFMLPAFREDLALLPFIENGDRYLVPCGSLLAWGLRTFVERELNPDIPGARNRDPRRWHAYLGIRASVLERVALDALAEIFPSARSETNLNYAVRVGDQTIEGEVDGLVLWGPVAVLIEAKSGALSWKARAGSLPHLDDALRKTLAKAQKQVATLRSLLVSGNRVVFRRDGKVVCEVDGGSLSHVIPIAVTLDDMSVFTTELRQLVQAGVLAAEGLPWAVLFYDLRVIAELCESPTQFLSFFQRRGALTAEGRFSSMTELDFWGWYQRDGLLFDAKRFEGFDFVQLSSGTSEIEHYYYYLDGWRSEPTARPRMSGPESIMLLVRALDEQPSVLGVQTGLDLLNLDPTGKERVHVELTRYLRMVDRDGKVRGMAFTPEGTPERLLALVCGPALGVDAIDDWMKRLAAQSRHGTRSVVAVGIVPGPRVALVVERELAA